MKQITEGGYSQQGVTPCSIAGHMGNIHKLPVLAIHIQV